MHALIKQILEGASAHALATSGPHGINVIPVSVVALKEDEIHLYDFFMQKTAENISAEPAVALTSWQGFNGIQIKARAVYDTSSNEFANAETEMKKRFPDRTLRAVIRLTPQAVYDIAPGAGGKNILE